MNTERLGLEIDIKQGPGPRTLIECEALGYLTIADSLQEAIEDIQEFLDIDPLLSDVPSELKKVEINVAARRIVFQFSPELLLRF